MAFRPIRVYTSLCTGCRACEAACVFRHEGVLGTSSSRIRVRKDEAEGLDDPRLCHICTEPACIPSCPENALGRDPQLGVILLDESLCTGCGVCIDACPFGSVSKDPRTGRPLFCDLCGGAPACILRCSPGALKTEGGLAGE
jgi:anaerobic carbon-monoxide dehydrogenase iron sulfur subunit